MIDILFISGPSAYLPEVIAYRQFFNTHGLKTASIDTSSGPLPKHKILWQFAGFLKNSKNSLNIHEYASLSTPPFPRIKNKIKRIINDQPDLRLFLNSKVKEEMNFKDNIPYIFRDMGVSRKFAPSDVSSYEYDFGYIGTIATSRKTHLLISHFGESLKDHNLVLVGTVHKSLKYLVGKYNNVTFLGARPHEEIPEIMHRIEYIINFTPDVYPYSFQTSTKVLEALAMRKKIITTKSPWLKNAYEQLNFRVFTINSLEDIKTAQLETFQYRWPDPENLYWENQFIKINLLGSIQDLLDK